MMACLLALALAVPDRDPITPPADPVGVWAVYYGGNQRPSWTLVVEPQYGGRYATLWYRPDGSVGFHGVMRWDGESNGVLIEQWRSVSNTRPGFDGAIWWRWTEKGGADQRGGMTFRKR
jgi:hypothetical protein